MRLSTQLEIVFADSTVLRKRPNDGTGLLFTTFYNCLRWLDTFALKGPYSPVLARVTARVGEAENV